MATRTCRNGHPLQLLPGEGIYECNFCNAQQPKEQHYQCRACTFHSCTPCSIEAKEKQREGAKPAPAGAEADVRIVKLNIGGFKYSTTRATLLSIPNSYFAALLEERIPTAKDEKGAYFIDRDGQFFPPILTYLRTKELNVAPHERKSVLREAKFYLLSPLVHLLQSNNGLEDELQQSRWHSQALKYFEVHEAKIDLCIQKLISKGRVEAKIKITNVEQDGPPQAPPNADLILFPIRGAAAQTIDEAKVYFFRRGYGVSRSGSGEPDPESDLSIYFGPFAEAKEGFVYPSHHVRA